MVPRHPTALSGFVDPFEKTGDVDDVLFHPPIPPKLAPLIHKVVINVTKNSITYFTDHLSNKEQFDAISQYIIKGHRTAQTQDYFLTIKSSGIRNELVTKDNLRDDEGYWSDEDTSCLAQYPTKLMDAISHLEFSPGKKRPWKVILKKNYPKAQVHLLFKDIMSFATSVAQYLRDKIENWREKTEQEIWPPFVPPDNIESD